MSNYVPAVGSNTSPVGKPMNCNTWGTYEAPNTSPTAGFCNGGTVDGEMWAPCPSQNECRQERNYRNLGDARTRLPVANQSTVRVVGQPPRSIYGSGYSGTPSYPSYGTAPTSLPQRQPTPQVFTPSNNNPYLDTPRVSAGGDHSPTYLPAPEEHFLRRLLANMIIGALEAAAFHVSSFLRNVDIWPYNKGGPKK